MNKINILPENLANKIAAGEVVQRPASVVKELLENSIDAGADEIIINIKNGGKEAITIIDNGTGMEEADAKLCLQRHATSKIKNEEDLFNIKNYGFRGEALPSIASVSIFEIETSIKGAGEGSSILVEGGNVKHVKKCPPIIGTKMSVRDLFFNTPARKKFQKSVTTEFNHILEVFYNQAIICNNISFELIHNNRTVLKLLKTDDRQKRIADIYGPAMKEEFYIVNYKNDLISITGYTSKKTFTRSNRNMQKVFVNNRVVKDKIISSSIQTVYRDILMTGRFPVLFLFISVSNDFVDVNVHPAKHEVKFKDEGFVFNSVKRAVKESVYARVGSSTPVVESKSKQPMNEISLSAKSPRNDNAESISKETVITSSLAAFRNDEEIEAKEKTANAILEYYEKEKPSKPVLNSGGFGGKKAVIASAAKQSMNEITLSEKSPCNDKETGSPVKSLLNNEEKTEVHEQTYILKEETSSFNILDFKLQEYIVFNNLYFISILNNELYIIDQHAAHERVLYEKFKSNFENSAKLSQELLFPVNIEVLPNLQVLFVEMIPQLNNIGFKVEEFGKDSFVIRAVPAFIKEKNVEIIINNILDDINDMDFNPKFLLQRFDEVIKIMACRCAYKAGDKIEKKEFESIMNDLLKLEESYTCPHGRPIIVKFNNKELEKMFLRKK